MSQKEFAVSITGRATIAQLAHELSLIAREVIALRDSEIEKNLSESGRYLIEKPSLRLEITSAD